ncbi:hypothetical protein [Rhizobium rhizogenes]|uniref:hypothetical protein n=1 Tax=Rhizobium rhizogenes TaxID=359 RepID=UPI0038675B85
MLATIYAAIEKARQQAADELSSVGSELTPPAYDYFAAVAHQKLFLLLCGADPETFRGRKPRYRRPHHRKWPEHIRPLLGRQDCKTRP